MSFLFGDEGGRNSKQIEDSPELRNAVANKEMQIAVQQGQSFEAEELGRKRRAALQKNFIKGVKLTEDQTARVVGNVFEAAGTAMRQRPSFSQEQIMLGQMFGHGEKIWGVNNQPVKIHNDLNSSRSDPWDETASMFGSGPFGERSGLF